MSKPPLTAEEKKKLDEKKAEDRKQTLAFTDKTNLMVKNLASGAAAAVYDDLGVFIAYNRDAGDNKFHNIDCDKHYYNNVIVKAVTAVLTRNYHTNDPRIIPRVQETLQSVLLLITKKKDLEWPTLADAMDLIFDETRAFYAKDGMDKYDSHRETMSDMKATAEWRKTLAFPQWVDVWTSTKWRPAQIQEENEKKQFKIAFDYGADAPTEWIDRESPRLAPHWSRSNAYFGKWRRDLKVGSRLDSLDTVQKWYTGHVMEVNGDWLHLNYDGWAAKFNEWISRTSDRLAEWRTQGIVVENGGRESNGIPYVYQEKTLDSAYDPEGVCAVWRGKDWGSYCWAENVNFFGEQKGFEILFNRFRTFAPPLGLLPILVYKKYCEAMARTANIFAKPWCKEWLPVLKSSVFDTFLSFGDNELRFLAKEPLEIIVTCIDKLLSRCVVWVEQISIVEKFNLEISLKRFRCGNVERQLNGLTAIMDATTRCRKYNQGWLQVSTLMEWCAKNQVLEDCYGKNSHSELMKRSVDLLKFLAEHNKFERAHIDLIWSAIDRAIKNSDDGTLKILYKVLEDVAWLLEQGLIDYLFEKLRQIPMVEYMSATVNLLKEMARWTYKAGPAAVPKAMEMLWLVFQDGSGANFDIMLEARRHLEEILGLPTQKNSRQSYMNMCIANLKEGKSVPSALNLLMKIIDHYPEVAVLQSDVTKDMIIAAIEKDHKLVDLFFTELHRFKERTKKIITERGMKGKEVNTLIVGSSQQYIHHIRDRYSFLYYILTNSTLVIEKARLDELWQLAFHDSNTAQERENTFKWFRKACGVRNTAKAFTAMDDEVTELAYRKFMKDVDATTITKSAFECWERFFLHINERAKKLECKGEDFTVLEFATLDGLEYLWRVALECKRTGTVVPKAIALLNKVHEKLADGLKAQVGAIRNRYIQVVMTHAKNYLAQEKKMDAAAFTARVERCISLITNQLDASESRGTCGLRAHGSQARGQLLEISFQYTDTDKRYEGQKPSVHPVRMYSNDTLWDLRSAIGKILGFIPDIIKIIAAGRVFGQEQNAKPLKELKLKPTGEMLIVQKNRVQGTRFPLSDGKGNLTQAYKAAMTEIFKGYAKNKDGTMSIEDMASYIIACGAGESNATPQRMADIFRQFGDAATHKRMDPEGFIGFYRQAAEERVDAVWNDLIRHGFRWDLRKEDEVVIEERAAMEDKKLQAAEQKLLPRYLLSTTNDYFHLLFNALNLDEHLAQQMWTLVQRLPTNPDLHRKLFELDIVNAKTPEWDDLLDSRSAYKLLYSLQILESLTEPTEETEDEKAQKAEERAAWRKKFLLSGGFQHLYSILVNRKGFIAAPTTQLRKSCLQLLLKMLYNFIISAMAAGQTTTALLDQFEKIRLENVEAAKEPDLMAGDVPNAPPLTQDEKAGADSKTGADSEPGSMMAEDSIQSGGLNEAKGSEEDEKKKAEAKEKKEKEAKEKEAKEAKEKAEAEKKKRESLPEFHKLVRQMSTNFASKILSFVSFADLQSCLLSIIHSVSSQAVGPLSTEDSATVEFAINLWVSIVLFQPEALVPGIYKAVAGDSKSAPGADSKGVPVSGADLIRIPLFCPISPRVRKQFGSALYQICANTKPASFEAPAAYFLSYLLKMLPSDANNRDCRLECEEYFSVLAKLLGDAITAKAVAAGANASKVVVAEYLPLGQKLVAQLIAHTSTEQYPGTAGHAAGGVGTSAGSAPGVSTDRVDKVLAGIMQLLIVLVSKEESFRTTLVAPTPGAGSEGLVRYVFQQCLFGELEKKAPADAATAAAAVVASGAASSSSTAIATPARTIMKQKPGVPKCKSKPTRGIAFSLLSTVCRGNAKNYEQLLELVVLQHQTIPKITQFEYNPEKQVISASGYVGLRNMGSTCYMNSLMQQLYMIPKLRYGVLLPLDTEAEKGPAQRDDSLLWQLQTMFGYLSTSEKQAFDTAKFCASYKDEKGAPINPRIQQDVQEFFGTLVDRLEKRLKGSAQAGLFKHLFGGQLVNQLICTDPGCKAVREHTEPYLTTSLQVKGRASLTDSLETYINGEILSGVNCSTCGKKVDTQKRACLGTLANVMVFHLKRFELNYETFQHEKLNGRFEFPFFVNLEPYTKEGLLRRALEIKKKDFPALNIPAKYSVHPQEYYEYQLVGVIIHTGSAQAGHYYSFIKDRNAKPAAVAAPVTPTTTPASPTAAAAAAAEPPAVWLEFNDNVVRPFDSNKLEEQCFGGDQEVSEKSWSGFETFRTQERAKNAYMLIYERNPKFKKEVPPKPLVVAEAAPVAAASGDSKSAPSKSADVKGADAPTATAAAPSMDKATETALANLRQMIEEANRPATAVVPAAAPAGGDKAAPAAPPIDVLTGGVPAEVLQKPIVDLVPQPVLKAVAEDNATFLHDRQIFNAHYFRFMNELVKIASYPDIKEYDPPAGTPNPALPLVQLAVKFALDTLARAGDNAILPEYLNSLCGQLNGNLPAARWLAEYLATKPVMCSELIMGCREKSIRKAFMDLVVHLFKLLSPHEDKFFHEEVKAEEPASPADGMAAAVAVAAAKDAKDNKNAPGQYEIPPLYGAGMRPRATSLRLMCTFISILNDATKNWMKFEHYFELYYEFAKIGYNQRKALVDRQLIRVLGDFMLGEHSPYWDPRKKLPTMGNRMVPPSWLNTVKTLNQMIRSCATDAPPAKDGEPKSALSPQSLPGPNGTLLPVSDGDKKMITASNFYIFSFGPILVNLELTEVILHWCYENEKFSSMMIDMILNGIERSNQITVKAWWDILDPICKIKDKTQGFRLGLAMAPNKGVLHKIWYYRQRHVPFTFAAMKLLTATMDTNPEWAKWAMGSRREWSWIDTWLKAYITRRHGHIVAPLAEKKERQDAYDKYCAMIVKVGGEVRTQKEGKQQKDGKEGGGDRHAGETQIQREARMLGMGGSWSEDDDFNDDDRYNDIEGGGSPGGGAGGKRARPNEQGGGGGGGAGVTGPNLQVQGTAIQPPAAGGAPPAAGPDQPAGGAGNNNAAVTNNAAGGGAGGAGGANVPAQIPRNQPRDDSALDEMARQQVRFDAGGGGGGGGGNGVRNRHRAQIGPQPAGSMDDSMVMGGDEDGAITGGGDPPSGGGGTIAPWACPVCTFENAGRITCEMCATPKP